MNENIPSDTRADGKQRNKQGWRDSLKKAWWFLWESDSIWSWLANVVLAFLIIKFIVYPGLGFLLDTSFPVVAVVSGSMEHDGTFDDWWNSRAYCDSVSCSQAQWYAARNVSEETFQHFSFKNGFNKGDIMILHGIEPKNIKTGDVLVFFSSTNGDPIIHRVMSIEQQETEQETGVKTGAFIFQTKGDHNGDAGAIDSNIEEQQVIGKAVFRIPLLGWIKIGFVQLIPEYIMNNDE